ncbi:MAG: YcgN family cysteine cluster protein [Chromatiaceae bacterium]|nr:YcgN family cysteine cluster protein [Gammaproteobacteria bacterium]MCP5300859.1 YcgN family cysteine cluster protein [Chromatiaceae bacterium]MCP5421668.1 YcgN family cysteine cluster protein [Chromatiaceae bacterium]
MADTDNPFWQRKSLRELSRQEWESLCDGCTKCCHYRLEDVDTRAIYFTNVHCRLLDPETGRCTDYSHRSERVPDCVTITPEVLEDPYWLPRTCAYRLLAEGRPLPRWHPLVSGDPLSVETAGQRVCRRTICEDDAGELEQHLVDWID